MNVVGACILVVLVLVVLFSPRRIALLGMMAGVLYLTQAQQVEVFGINLYAMRFMEMAGFIRVMVRREFSFGRLNKIDLVLLYVYGFTTIVCCLREAHVQVDAIAMAVDTSFCYFTFRGLIGGIDDFRWFLRAFIILLAPYMLLVLVESKIDHNPFMVIGGFDGSLWSRSGRPRCFGSFRQPDTLGMFAASFLPLYVGLACIARERKLGVFGAILCLAIVWAANSGGAASGAAMGLLGWLFWRIRTGMRMVRWGIVAMFVLAGLMMKAPIWYILAKASSVSGGDGWHRSYLIDVTWRHISQWWLAGMPVIQTADWFPYTVGGTADITNQYIAFGLMGGVGAIALFIVLLTRAYSGLGHAMAAVRLQSQSPAETEFLLWGLGVMLTVHIANWFGIAYFDQMYVVWFMQLATISVLCEEQSQTSHEIIGEATGTGMAGASAQ